MARPAPKTVDASFPAKLQGLFRSSRYKVLHGGRGSGKSWGVARAMLITAAASPLRILCAREVQKSIKESVHQLLADQVQALGLGQFYRILDTEIRGKNGSKFAFSGLASHTVESIKSYEGYDRVWIEEAQTVSKTSWDILTPTIRKPGSEIWLTLNPDMATGETYRRFVESPPPDAWVEQVNYHDNPWFPAVLESERAHCQATRPRDEYRNIWLGEPRRTADGAYYADQMQAMRSGGRIRELIYTPTVPVNTFWDLGWNDTTAIWWHQYVAGEDRFLRAYEASGETLAHYAKVIQDAGYTYDAHYLPHDAENKSLQTGKSVMELLRDLMPGHRFEVVPRVGDVLEGIHQTRLRLAGPVFMDRIGCHDGIIALENYRKEWDPKQEVFRQRPLHDRFSNYADAMRQWGQGFTSPSAARRASRERQRTGWKGR